MQNLFQGRIYIVRLLLMAAMFALIASGVAAIYASGNPIEGHSGSGMYAGAWKKQIVFAFAGCFAILAINLVDYRAFGTISYWLYAAVLAVLALLLVGRVVTIDFSPIFSIPVINGTCRWIRFGPPGAYLQVQPSEFCKLAYILALAWYLRFRSNYRKFARLIGPFAMTLLAMVLILFEPDLGTVLLMMPILFAVLFVAGAKVRHLLIIILLAVLASPFLWFRMNYYQRQRISSVLLQNEWVRQKAKESSTVSKVLTGRDNFDEARWLRGSGWQLKHSKIAIASGGVTGYGFRRGPYIEGPFTKYNLPERHNDFIFAIIAHQWGLSGCLVLLFFYAVIIACGVEIAWTNTDPFARLVTVGILAMFAVEVIVNISMTLGIMPITGLTLPFLSYGGSSLVVSMASIGLLNNIGKYRPFTVAGRAFETEVPWR